MAEWWATSTAGKYINAELVTELHVHGSGSVYYVTALVSDATSGDLNATPFTSFAAAQTAAENLIRPVDPTQYF